MTLASALKEKNKTVYQQVAEEFGVTPRYVGKIARSEREPQRLSAKGTEIKKKLQQLLESEEA
jgi:transcriptional regulator with XRE-family HTH domain